MSSTDSASQARSWLSPAWPTLIAPLFVPAGFAKTMAPTAKAGFMAGGSLPDWPALAVLVGLFEIAAGIARAFGPAGGVPQPFGIAAARSSTMARQRLKEG